MQKCVKGALALCLGLSAVAAVPAMAQQANQINQFAGFNVGGSAAYRDNKVDMQGFVNASPSKSDAAAQFDASYAFALSPVWTLAVGGTYDLNKTDFGSVSYTDGGQNGTVTAKLKNHWSLYLAPGYVIAPNWQVYGKLAYHRADGEYNDSLSGSGKTSLDGMGYGVGVNYAATRNLRVGFEVQHVNFSRKSVNETSGKPEFTEAAVKVGYQF